MPFLKIDQADLYDELPGAGTGGGPPSGVKAMTLKLTETDYRRLKRYGFENDLTSQAILESLVLKFLKDKGC